VADEFAAEVMGHGIAGELKYGQPRPNPDVSGGALLRASVRSRKGAPGNEHYSIPSFFSL
jgi:hypothetical protein